MDTHRISKAQVVHFAAFIGHIAPFGTVRKGYKDRLAANEVNLSDVPIKNVLFIVVADLHDLVPFTIDRVPRLMFCFIGTWRIDAGLEQAIQVFYTAGIAVHGRKDLYILPGKGSNHTGIRINDVTHGLFFVHELAERKIRISINKWHKALVDAVGISHNGA